MSGKYHLLALAALLTAGLAGNVRPAGAAVPPPQPAWVAANGGVYGATVMALARDPDRPTIRYAGTARGVARTTNSGSSWQAANRGLPPGCRVAALLPLRERPSVVLAGCYGADYGNGLYRSADRGLNWAPAGNGLLPDGTVYALLEGTNGLLLAGSSDGVYRSLDDGAKWARVLQGSGGTLSIYTLTRDPFSPLTYYAATGNTIYKSVDGGVTWFEGNNGLEDLGNSQIEGLVADPTRKGRLYLGVSDKGVYRSIDGGSSWQGLDNAPGHAYSLLVQPLSALAPTLLTPDLRAHLREQAVRPKGAKRGGKVKKGAPLAPAETALLLVGTDSGVQASVDGGGSWSNRTEDANGNLLKGGRPYPGLPDSTTVYALLSFGRSAEVLAGTGGGVWRSTDLARSWYQSGPGLAVDATITALATDPAAPGTVYYGTDGNGVERSHDSGATLEDASSGLPDNTSVADLLIQPARQDRLVAALNAPSGGVAISTDGGDSWRVTGLAGRFVNAVIADPHDPSTLYAGLARGGVGWSADGGASWRILGRGLPAAGILSLAADPHDALRLLAGTDQGLYLSTDQGDHWTAAGRGLPAGAVGALNADPLARHSFLAGTPEGLYRSRDGGVTWAAVDGAPAGVSVTRLARDTTDPRVLLAAAGAGVYRSEDDGATWTARDEGLPGRSTATALAPAGRVSYTANAYGAYFLSPTGPLPARAVLGGRYFAVRGHSLAQPFLGFWQAHGGLTVFGYPLTEALRERALLVQYFERARLEYHAASGNVVLTPLGSVFSRGRGFARVKPFPDGPLRIYLQQTLHSLAEPFLTFWRAHGAATVFGNPISEVLHEENGDGTGTSYTLQYFQNARLEYHPENKGTPYEIELGNLGEQLLRQKGWLQ